MKTVYTMPTQLSLVKTCTCSVHFVSVRYQFTKENVYRAEPELKMMMKENDADI